MVITTGQAILNELAGGKVMLTGIGLAAGYSH